MFHHPPTALLLALTGCLGALLLSGCKTLDEATSDSPSQQAASASQSLGMLLDASNEAVLSDTSGGDSVKAVSDPLAEAAPNFTGRAAGTRVIDLANFSVNAQKIFPAGTASGTLTVTYSGSAASSWPAGTTTLYTGQVTVTAANVLITNGNGDALSIPSGSFGYTLEAVGAKTDTFNWVITTDAAATVTNLTATLTRGTKTHSLSLAGNRTVHAEIRRTYTTDGAGAVTANTRASSVTISGTVAGSSLATTNPQKNLSFTGWTVTLDGIPVTWNRYAALSTLWDYTKLGTGAAFTVTSTSDATFVSTTINGGKTTVGPLTAAQMAALLRAKIEAQWL